MARNVLAYGNIFESSGEPLSPEDFVIILNGSQIKIILAFLESYAHWKSSWEYPSNSQWDIIESYLADIYLRLGGEPMYQISEGLQNLNTTLQEIRDIMQDGNGDGNGNSIKDLIFWLKLLFAISGEGGAVTPLLGSVNGTLQSMNTAIIDNESSSSLAAIETAIRDAIEGRDINTTDIVAAIESIECGGGGGVILPQNVIDNGQNLLRNGEWEEGENRNIPSAFFPHYWLSAGNTSDGEFWTRGGTAGNYYISNVEEVNCDLRQTAVIPTGYGLPKIIVESSAINLIFNLRVYVNDVLTNLSIVESTTSYYEADFHALPKDSVKIEFNSTGCNVARVGKVSLMCYPVGVEQVISLPPIGGSMGKGRNRAIKPDKRLWETTYGSNDSADNWLVDKLEALGDWWGMVLKASKTVVRSLTATRIFRMDTTTKLCNLYFNTSMGSGSANITVDMFNGTTWDTIRQCSVTGSYVTKIDFPEFVGDKLVRITLNPTIVAGGQDFWFYDLEIEEID